MTDRVRSTSDRLLIHRPARRPVMLKEIHAAPERVEILLRQETGPLARALSHLRDQPPPLLDLMVVRGK